MTHSSLSYRAPLWLPGGHLQTIVAAKLSHAAPVLSLHSAGTRQRWDTPDGDFVDVDWPTHDPSRVEVPRTLLVLFHGLEGGRQSHYVRAFANETARRGMGFALPHFRGCGGSLNSGPRAYHSGDHEEIDWMLRRCLTRWRSMGGQDVVAVGVSLGGNALLRWAEEQGSQAASVVQALAAVCAPTDLAASGRVLGRGFNRFVYTRLFLQTMVPKALAKWEQYPGLFDREALKRARTLYEFDNAFTAPLHGFLSTEDYWERCSSRSRLADIRVPALVLHARNDPFIPVDSLPKACAVGQCVSLWQSAHGGHVGFPVGRFPGHVHAMPSGVLDWVAVPQMGRHHLAEVQ